MSRSHGSQGTVLRWLSSLVAASILAPCAIAQTLPQRINDTGAITCYSGAGSIPVTVIACNSSSWPGQDGASGRDAATQAGTLAKIGDGIAGFDFTKVSNAGNDLPANAAAGTAPGAWGCTRDNVTGLVWLATVATSVSWGGARQAEADARSAAHCGFSDWRVPASSELHGLVDYAAVASSIDATYFPATATGFHWTSEADPSAPAQRARIVNFGGGFINGANATQAADVRLVRGGQWFGAPQDAGDGTVGDPRTGLVWDRCSIGQGTAPTCAGDAEMVTWETALQRVQQRNAQSWNGHNDWRLPNAKELASLLHPSRRMPAIDADLFPNTLGAAYWSSTSQVDFPGNAWTVFFGEGNVFAKDKATRARVRIVRTGTAATGGNAPDALFADSFDISAQAPQPPADALPVIALTTAGGAGIDREVYVDGNLSITSGDPALVYSGSMEIRGRGNSTWSMPKKPYRIKLAAKSGLLGMPSSKHWALLANYADKSLLRNLFAFALGERLAMAWTPRSRMAEVTLNGEYLGVYQLVETIRVDEDRVDITEIDSGDVTAPAITGGYLFELDGRRDCDAAVQFDTSMGIPYCIDTPDEEAIVPQQRAYLLDYMNTFETVLYSSSFADPATGYPAYADASTFIDWYLVNELTSNIDAQGLTSIWSYKDRNGKLNRGPLWDFDISTGNANYADSSEPQGFWIRQGTYYNRFFQDPVFAAATRAKWDASKAAHIDSLPDFIEANALAIQAASGRNFQKWPILRTQVWPNVVVTGSKEGEIAYLRDWLEQRIAWLDANL